MFSSENQSSRRDGTYRQRLQDQDKPDNPHASRARHPPTTAKMTAVDSTDGRRRDGQRCRHPSRRLRGPDNVSASPRPHGSTFACNAPSSKRRLRADEKPAVGKIDTDIRKQSVVSILLDGVRAESTPPCSCSSPLHSHVFLVLTLLLFLGPTPLRLSLPHVRSGSPVPVRNPPSTPA